MLGPLFTLVSIAIPVGIACLVVSMTVTVNTYNASYSESQSFRFVPRATAP